jgi:hypothetical protein
MLRCGMRNEEELSEFDMLDATEKAAMEGALNRCRALVNKVVRELGEKKYEDFANSLLLADFQASLQHAAELLELESRTDPPKK